MQLDNELESFKGSLGINCRNYTKLFWDNITQKELDCIDTLLRIKG